MEQAWGAGQGPSAARRRGHAGGAAALLACAWLAGASAPPAPRAARDLAYGPDRLQRLDVLAAPGLHGAPVVVFLHGGAYLFGDKGAAAWQRNARFLADHGIVSVNADYRLAPGATWPSGPRDVAAIVAFLRREAPRFGGDPRRIVMLGHSAGATHVAGYVFDRRFQPPTGPGIAGAVLVSGRYALALDRRDPNGAHMEAYFGTGRAAWADRAVLAHVATAPRVPLLIAVAGDDNPGLDVGGATLFAAVCRRDGRCPQFLQLEGETHQDEMPAMSASGNALGEAVLRFANGVARGE